MNLIGPWAILIGVLELDSARHSAKDRALLIITAFASIAIGVGLMRWVFAGAVLISAIVDPVCFAPHSLPPTNPADASSHRDRLTIQAITEHAFKTCPRVSPQEHDGLRLRPLVFRSGPTHSVDRGSRESCWGYNGCCPPKLLLEELNMRKYVMLFALSLVLAGATFAAQHDTTTYSGEIMDSRCAATGGHSGREAKACTLACVSGGASFVLYSPIGQTVYQLDDQKKPAEFAGEKVKVIGTLDKTTKTIHVTDIEAEV